MRPIVFLKNVFRSLLLWALWIFSVVLLLFLSMSAAIMQPRTLQCVCVFIYTGLYTYISIIYTCFIVLCTFYITLLCCIAFLFYWWCCFHFSSFVPYTNLIFLPCLPSSLVKRPGSLLQTLLVSLQENRKQKTKIENKKKSKFQFSSQYYHFPFILINRSIKLYTYSDKTLFRIWQDLVKSVWKSSKMTVKMYSM